MTLTEFLLARLAEDEERAEHEREFHEDWPDTPACDSCNPARVLADVAAKRAIVESAWHECGPSTADDWLLPLLALPYADHESYDESWRP